MLSYSVAGSIRLNTTLVIDAWLTSSKLLIEMQWMMEHQMTICLIVQVAVTLLDGMQKAIPCLMLFWSCKFSLIFHRFVFGLKIMRNFTPYWKSSISTNFDSAQVGDAYVCLFLGNDLPHCHKHFQRALKLCRGCCQSQTVYLFYYQNYSLLHVWQCSYSYKNNTQKILHSQS